LICIRIQKLAGTQGTCKTINKENALKTMEITFMSIDIHLAYKKILERSKTLAILGSAETIINWDMETMMPPRAVELRSEQLALLSEIHHKTATSPATGKLLESVLKHPKYEYLTELEKRNIQLIKKNYDEQTKLPTELVKAIAKQQTISVNTWKKAKAQKNFSLFKPELVKLVSLNRQAAEILMKVKETKTPYDALIDIYEPKMTSQATAKVFSDLQRGLESLLGKIKTKDQPDTSILKQPIAAEKQREIAKLLMQTLGYETSPAPNAGGRLDETEHPFTAGYYDDVRITTHYYVNDFASSVFSVLHETGHALYEQGLPQEWKYQPIGTACSMGVHESQSRLYENVIGRSKEFWTTILPKIRTLAKPSLSNIKLDQFIHAVNAVKPSKIRIEADEVTYSLHVIIRFQMENDLFSGKITVEELPQVWNKKYEQILGVKIENDSEGVMQDTHWASGYGYFPTYALGNIYTGQIIAAIQKENPSWREELAKGNLTTIRKWTAANIYSCGDLYDPADLIKKATGTELTVKPYLSYLQEKYGQLYGF
jgi:carboxypeptidase Taq